MNTRFDTELAVAELLQAWTSNRQIAGLTPAARPARLDDGYRIQDRFVDGTGDFVCGWKLGVGSPAAMRAAAADRPLVGRLLASRFYRERDTVRIASSGPVTVEFEIVFVLACDIAPSSPPVPATVAVDAAHVGFEFVLSRYTDRRAVGQPSFAADNVGFEACVIGPQIDLADVQGVRDSVRVSLDETEVARTLTGDDATDPWLSVQFLMEYARERDITLRKGDFIFTGAAAKPFVVEREAFRLTSTWLDREMNVSVKAGRKKEPSAPAPHGDL
ncbi:MAG TPA: fumarylacetoacetate hydrolase family protein [Paraburkholderia sp.]|jgi:2-keto-4-pentenoate hydratase